MDQLAIELNEIIEQNNPHLIDMMSSIGKKLFFPKGILSQSAEAKEKAHKLNGTIGIAFEKGDIMHLPSVMDPLEKFTARESLTYAPSFGIPELRQAWQKELFEKNPSLKGKNISTPVVTCGITNAVSIFADIWIEKDDVVILPDMIWGNYRMIFNVKKGAEILHYPLFSKNNGFNIEAFKKTVDQAATKHRKVIVILNFPHNPTGYTVTNEEGDRIVEILTQTAQKGNNVIVACDDAYFGLFYSNALKESIFSRLCDKDPRLLPVKLDGATKENFVWGLRLGFITYGCKVDGDLPAVHEALAKKTAGCVRGTISNASHLGQSILLRSMRDKRYHGEKKEKFEILKTRALRVKEVLSDPKYNQAWDVYPFNSGYFMCLRLKSVDAETLRVHLLEKYGVGLIALGKTDIRVAFSCIEQEEIQGLFDLILQGAKEVENM